MSKGPWFIAQDDARKRDAAAARDVATRVERCIVPGMPDDTIAMKLAARGIGARDWRLVRPILEAAR